MVSVTFALVVDDDAIWFDKVGFLEKINLLFELETVGAKVDERFTKDVAQRAKIQFLNLAEMIIFTLLMLVAVVAVLPYCFQRSPQWYYLASMLLCLKSLRILCLYSTS
jgi:hypothetical protein